MNISDNVKEWASVGAGAMVSGALAVIVMQMAIVRRANTTAEFEAAAQTARTLDSTETGVESNSRSRLLLPDSEVATAPEQPLSERASDRVAAQTEPARAPVTAQASGQATGQVTAPVTRVERLESGSGKDSLAGPEHVAGTVQRKDSEGSSDKASQTETSPRLATAVMDRATRRTKGPQPTSSINPKLRDQSQTVNAAFDEVGVRTPGEDFSWDVHEVFKDDEGPMPFFFVDEYTGTLMFGLGWQH